MSGLFVDKHTIYVLGAYGATALILVGLIWATVVQNARARRDLDGLERERKR